MAEHRAIRFAVQLVDADSGSAWVRLAQRMEALGYSAISLPDHLGRQFAPIPALAALAVTTARVRLTMSVLANDFRHPAVLAKEAATVDVLSGGRLDLGLGAGWAEDEYVQAGIPFDPPATRIDRLAESVAVIRGLLSDAPVTHRGAHYRVSGLTGMPKPAQRRVPIMLGGGGRRILGLAAREADIVSIAVNNRLPRTPGILSQATRQSAQERIAWVKDAAGARFGDLELNIRVLVGDVGADRASSSAALSKDVGLDPDDLADSPYALVGTVPEITDHVLRVRDELGINFFTVSARVAEAMAPVVESVSGR